MKKLTIKELACYLPYGLKYYANDTIDTVTSDNLSLLLSASSFGKIKILLRPLSDLTKEIEVNREKFVPLQKLAENYWLLTDSSHPFYFRTMDGEDAIDYLNDNKPEWWTANVRDIAISWHFDVFGLIEKGLAVDINSLTKSAV